MIRRRMPDMPVHDDAEEGAVGVLTGLMMVAVCGIAALTIDAGHIQYQRRSLQAAVDAAALSAARDLNDANSIASAVLTRQNFGTAARTVTVGTYADDTTLTAPARFTLAAAAGNAVRVEAETTVPLGLMRLLIPATTARVAATATATHRPEGGFTIGSGVAALDGGIANQVLGQLLGGSVNLSAAAYTGLLTSNIRLVSLLDATAGVQAGTYQQLLGSQVGAGRLLGLAAGVLAPGASQTAGSSLMLLSQPGNSGRTFGLGTLLNLGVHQTRQVGELVADRSYADASVNALDLVRAAAALGGPTSAFDLPLGINIPGLATVSARLLMIQPPQSSGFGPVNTTRASTAQVRLLLSVRLLALVGGGVVTVPILIEAAPASGVLTAVTCDSTPSTDTSMTVRATTGVARARIGTIPAAAFDNPTATLGTLVAAPIVATPAIPPLLPAITLISATADAQVGTTSSDMSWTATEIASRSMRSIAGGNLAGSLVGSLLTSLQLTVLGGPALNLVALRSVLMPVLSALDPVVDQILGAAGVRLGFAEIRPIGARCGVPSLVL